MTDPSVRAERYSAPPAVGHRPPRARTSAAFEVEAIAAAWLRGAVSEHLPAMNLCEVLARLPEPDRVILYLRTVEEWNDEQAAKLLGIDASSARERYLQAVLRLRAEWQGSPAARAFWRGPSPGLNFRLGC